MLYVLATLNFKASINAFTYPFVSVTLTVRSSFISYTRPSPKISSDLLGILVSPS